MLRKNLRKFPITPLINSSTCKVNGTKKECSKLSRLNMAFLENNISLTKYLFGS